MEYVILSSVNELDLERKVNTKITFGWRPQGGVCVQQTASERARAEFQHKAKFHQAMVKD